MKSEDAVLSAIAIFTLIFLFLLASSDDTILDADDENNWAITDICLDDHNSLATHEHVQIEIVINGSKVSIGPNIGIGDPGCSGMRGIHTHDNTGKLHIETPSPMDAPLGAFFQIWGESFSEEVIMGNYSDETHEVVLTVNGEVNYLYDSYMMMDGDQIEIEYRSL